MNAPRLSIFVRFPQPGTVKTRLIPALGGDGAARVYSALLDHTIAQARASGLDFELRVTGAPVEDCRRLWGDGMAIVDQGEGDLGDRMARVHGPALIIGSDCPGLNAAVLRAAAGALDERPVVIGPASDGGYYLIGFRDPAPWLFEDMEWSTSKVFSQTLARVAAQGIGPAVLPELSDIDTIEDLEPWPEFQ
ncbi:TIGR04282 family arsenosugar biosynthesis glycosyltransferase [Qipengyuania zhejiangensis]|uniref:TIGR04282 family arsenosugar biosynthesis glycosyltransferase n=1 Tax=Qipengyuania zhejiangensis TaxID=3077782 RepID=UPI002D76A6CD|nr:TIGR04282 family arsenosugar biosynthesis glycosyltransferase [Qipengyuania sp. Z2]